MKMLGAEADPGRWRQVCQGTETQPGARGKQGICKVWIRLATSFSIAAHSMDSTHREHTVRTCWGREWGVEESTRETAIKLPGFCCFQRA